MRYGKAQALNGKVCLLISISEGLSHLTDS